MNSNSEKKYHCDKATGMVYELRPEEWADSILAVISILYLLMMLAFFFWQLFDLWTGKHWFVQWIGYKDTERLINPSFRLVAYTFIGGGLGGVINGLRSFIGWHSERSAFNRRFVWKYIVDPWIGTTLALFAFALVRSGLAVLGGDFQPDVANARQTLSMFALGVLSGYGSREVFVWLDAQVTKLFKVSPQTKVPDLLHKTKEEAEKILEAANLKLGKVAEEPSEDEGMVGKVVGQDPLRDASIACGGTVDITVAVKKTE
jgi:hypothetical protein